MGAGQIVTPKRSTAVPRPVKPPDGKDSKNLAQKPRRKGAIIDLLMNAHSFLMNRFSHFNQKTIPKDNKTELVQCIIVRKYQSSVLALEGGGTHVSYD
jgi:hypothetical protein